MSYVYKLTTLSLSEASRGVATEEINPNRMKIALIGPAWPYRGGIAHHNALLAKYLRKHGHEVDQITFTRQYPGFLFPGRSQEEPDGAERERGEEAEPERMIDSINPITWWRTGKLLRSRNYDLHIFRFWLPFFGPAFGSIARRVHRASRRDVMVLLDNFIPHEPRPGDRFLTHRLFRYCNVALTQSSVVTTDLVRLYPDIPYQMRHHPVYEHFGGGIDRAEARRLCGVGEESRVILFFGLIRRYKGLDFLLQAMPEIVHRLPDVHLLAVGEIYKSGDNHGELIRQLAEQSPVADHITLVDEYVPDQQVAQWFSAADVVVLPYRSATNSGIVQIAYNFSVPAVVTDVGSLAEVVLDGQTGYVISEPTPEMIADAVENCFVPGRLNEFRGNIARELPKYSWDAFVEGIEALVRQS
jgi:glycosyltransferase involved in cell wall biosynthesis